ncbi:MAG: type II toxin-antitoxin system VapC family toxin [Bacteroidota bacterium]
MPLVLDASALIAFLNDEIGAEKVAPTLSEAIMSAVNVAEVLKYFHDDRGMTLEQSTTIFNHTGIKTIPLDEEQAIINAVLRPPTRPYGLSLGDRACLALAQIKSLPVLTADKNWTELDIGVHVRMIR